MLLQVMNEQTKETYQTLWQIVTQVGAAQDTQRGFTKRSHLARLLAAMLKSVCQRKVKGV